MDIGKQVYELDTPFLWVDLDLMEKNISRLAEYFRQAGVAWRPHTKGIKTPAIAHKLLKAGAFGVTCAKLGEAEVMAAAGIEDILIANQVVGNQKITRLVNLRRHADVMVAVDSVENARQISAAAEAKGVKIRALVEINCGMERAGVAPGEPAVNLAREIAALPGLQLAGMMAWEGHVVRIEDPDEKRQITEASINRLLDSVALGRRQGLELPIVSCGGSGSYKISANMKGVTEIQAGGAIFGDVTYRNWGAGSECALFVMTTVSSRPTPTRAIVDAGRKTMNGEVFMPEAVNITGARLANMSAEHGYLEMEDPQNPLKVGDKVNFIVGYGDWTVFLHDRLVGVRDGKVEVIWDILGRGKLT